jgi:hypothetical protein
MSTIGTVWKRARLTLGLTALELADLLSCTPQEIALAEAGSMAALRVLTGPFRQATGVDLYVLSYCLSDDLPPDLAVHAAPLAEALRERLRQLGQENRRPADWSAVRRSVAAMPRGDP